LQHSWSASSWLNSIVMALNTRCWEAKPFQRKADGVAWLLLIYTGLHAYEFMPMCACVCIYAYAHVYIYVWTYMYLYIYIYVYTCIYIYMWGKNRDFELKGVDRCPAGGSQQEGEGNGNYRNATFPVSVSGIVRIIRVLHLCWYDDLSSWLYKLVNLTSLLSLSGPCHPRKNAVQTVTNILLTGTTELIKHRNEEAGAHS